MKSEIDMINAINERWNTGSPLPIAVTQEEAAVAVDAMKKGRVPVRGLFRLAQVKKARLSRPVGFGTAGNEAKVKKVFDRLVGKDETRKALKVPYCDKGRNLMVATDGRKMLATRIPQGMEGAKNAGFCETLPWPQGTMDGVVGEIDSDPYVLSCYRQVALVEAGDATYNEIAAVSKLAAVLGKKGALQLVVRIGRGIYQARFLWDLVRGMFQLGCEKIAICEIEKGGPLQLFGIGCAVSVKGVIMPLRGEDMAVFEVGVKAA